MRRRSGDRLALVFTVGVAVGIGLAYGVVYLLVVAFGLACSALPG